MDSVPVPFVPRDNREDEILTDIYGRLPWDNISRLSALEGAVAIVLELQTQDYTELAQVISPGADAAWTEVDLSSYGVIEGDICDLEFRQTVPGIHDNDVGCRTKGSTVARLSNLKEE